MSTSQHLPREKKKQQEATEHINEMQNEINRLNEQATEVILKVEKKCNNFASHFPEEVGIYCQNPESLGNNICQPSTSVCTAWSIKSGYRIDLNFDENPYFENKVLPQRISSE